MKTRRSGAGCWWALGAATAWLLLPGCGSSSGDPDGGSCAKPCTLYTDCADNEDCTAGCCRRSTRCSQDATCLPSGMCVGARCVEMCLNDTDCPAMFSCVNGFCAPYPQDLYQALHAPDVDSGWTQQTPLKVGIAVVPLDFPVGVSMAGFGARKGPHTPYRDTLGGSESYWDRPLAKAFAFDNGLKRIVLVRTTTSWSTDHMVTDIARRVHAVTGQNYLNRIVLSANHTHSYPGNYSYWLPGRKMGVLGHGDFTKEMFERHTRAMSDAVLAAIEDLKPARFGYRLLDPMDPEGKVHVDRRREDFEPHDTRLISIRIDDEHGQPRAFLFNFGLHGTHSDDTAVTGDAPGSVELWAERKLQELTGLPVVAAFLSGASGDTSPQGDGSGLDDWRKIQEVGFQAWPILRGEFEALAGQTRADLELDIASLRAPINREVLGYPPGTFRDESGDDYLFGAFQCVSFGDNDPDTHFQDGALGCIFSCQMLTGGPPVPDFGKVRLNALRLGQLGFATLPGEPLGSYSRTVSQSLTDQGLAHAGVLGYSQDHHFYLMHADGWLQGGYEPSMGIWGWAEGDYFVELHRQMAERLMTQGGFVENNAMLPSWFELPDDSVPPTATPATDAGKTLDDAPEVLERAQMIVLRWTGGHPGVDLPAMTLEHETPLGWEPVVNAAGVPYTDLYHSSMIRYLGNYEADHTWQLTWEERLDFPLGRYRLRVDGHFWNGGARQPYDLTSKAFDLQANTRLRVEGLRVRGGVVEGVVFYPAGPTTDDGASAFASLAPRGYLHHTNRVPAEFPWPVPTDGSVRVAVQATPVAGGPALEVADVPVLTGGQFELRYVSTRNTAGVEGFATRSLPSSGFSADLGQDLSGQELDLTVTVQDAHGNLGSLAARLVAEAP